MPAVGHVRHSRPFCTTIGLGIQAKTVKALKARSAILHTGRCRRLGIGHVRHSRSFRMTAVYVYIVCAPLLTLHGPTKAGKALKARPGILGTIGRVGHDGSCRLVGHSRSFCMAINRLCYFVCASYLTLHGLGIQAIRSERHSSHGRSFCTTVVAGMLGMAGRFAPRPFTLFRVCSVPYVARSGH